MLSIGNLQEIPSILGATISGKTMCSTFPSYQGMVKSQLSRHGEIPWNPSFAGRLERIWSPIVLATNWTKTLTYPIPSMYGMCTCIWLIFMANVGKCTIHECAEYAIYCAYFRHSKSIQQSIPQKRLCGIYVYIGEGAKHSQTNHTTSLAKYYFMPRTCCWCPVAVSVFEVISMFMTHDYNLFEKKTVIYK